MNRIKIYCKDIYTNKFKKKILVEGVIKGYEFKIMTLGTHPTAYVKIPINHPCDILDIYVHGGITFEGNNSFLGGNKNIKWIGWDYAHYNDYYHKRPTIPGVVDKKWTVNEILKEVKSVIKQLIKKEE